MIRALRRSVLIGGTGLGLLAVSCRRPDDADFRQTNNVIAVLPLTGPFASKGDEHKLAIQMALRDLEVAGPIRRRPFQVFLVDAGATTECESRLREQVARLTEGGRLHLVGLLSSTTGAFKCGLKGAAGLGVPHVEVSSGSALDEVLGDKATEASGTAFSTRPLCMPEPLVTARFVTARQSTWQRVVFMRGSEPHDTMHTGMLRSELPLQGYTGSIVGEQPSGDDIVVAQKPYDPYLQRVMTLTPRPDVIYYHLNGDLNNLDFLKAAQRVGYPGRIVTCGMARADVLLDNVKQGGLTSYLAGAPVGGVGLGDGRLFFMMRGPIPSPALDRFSRDFEAFAGLKAEPFTSAAYDGAMLLGLGLAASVDDSLGAIAAAVPLVSRGGTKVFYGDARRAREFAESGIDLDYDGASGDVDQTLDSKLGFVVRGRFFVERIAPAGAGFEYQLATGAPDEQLAPRPASN